MGLCRSPVECIGIGSVGDTHTHFGVGRIASQAHRPSVGAARPNYRIRLAELTGNRILFAHAHAVDGAKAIADANAMADANRDQQGPQD